MLEKAHRCGISGGHASRIALGGIEGDMAALCVILQHICEVDASLGGIIFTQAHALRKFYLRPEPGISRRASFPKATSAKEMLVAFPVLYQSGADRLAPAGAKNRANDYTSQDGWNCWFWEVWLDRPLLRRAQVTGRTTAFFLVISLTTKAWKKATRSLRSGCTPARRWM